MFEKPPVAVQCGCAVWPCSVAVQCGLAVRPCSEAVRCGRAVWLCSLHSTSRACLRLSLACVSSPEPAVSAFNFTFVLTTCLPCA